MLKCREVAERANNFVDGELGFWPAPRVHISHASSHPASIALIDLFEWIRRSTGAFAGDLDGTVGDEVERIELSIEIETELRLNLQSGII